MDARLVAIRVDLQTIYRFLFVTAPAQTANLTVDLRRTTYSFRVLSEAEARSVKPQRLSVVSVGSTDTIERIAGRMAFPDRQVDRFRVLNGLEPGETVRPGQPVKLVTE
jgi:predicted Zn-dependent protease